MKINRVKRAHKHLQFYSNNFGFREPYQVLFDGTFCNHALKNHFQINQQLEKYLGTQFLSITSACIIIESENLGTKFSGVTQLLKTFKVHRCGHEKRPISGSACIKSLTKQSRYIVATQDRDLQTWIRKRAGVALLYLHHVAPTLEAPSEASNKVANRKTSRVLTVSKTDDERLKFLKEREGIKPEEQKPGKKKKVKGNPNPLSCKKKKTKCPQDTQGVKMGKVEKKARQRVKISKHVRELLKEKVQ